MKDALRVAGEWTYERWSAPSSDGTRHLLARGRFKNGITAAGLNDLLNAAFGAGTQRSWYGGLVDITGFSAFAPADTMAAHPGWQENTAYSGGARPQYSPGAASAGVIVNPTLLAFTFTAAATVHGLFLASNGTPGGGTGVLWATGAFDADQQMQAGEVLKVAYNLTAAAGQGS